MLALRTLTCGGGRRGFPFLRGLLSTHSPQTAWEEVEVGQDNQDNDQGCEICQRRGGDADRSDLSEQAISVDTLNIICLGDADDICDEEIDNHAIDVAEL